MTKAQKAIGILRRMKVKLNEVNANTCTSWKSQLASYVIIFFGKDSPEYDYITRYDFRMFGVGEPDWQTEQSKPFFHAFITDCIERIENYGLNKKEWKHIFITTNPALFWSIFTAMVLFAFWAGTQLAANKSSQTTSTPPKQQNDSTHTK